MSGATGFGNDDLGSLVMVRHRVAAGVAARAGKSSGAGATDVVGELEALTASALVIRRRDDSMVEVSRSSVLSARTVAVSPLAARTLEGVAARGWPAPDTSWLGQWMLRAAGGFTARANAVRPLGPPGMPLDDALAHVEHWYAARDLPARIQVVVGSSLDAALEQRGWPPDPEVLVMTAPVVQVRARLAAVSATPLPAAVTSVTPRPSPRWLAAFRGGSPGPEALAVLTGPPVALFAEVSAPGGAALAIGRAAVEPPWVGITAVEVAPEYRRQGLARSIMRTLLQQAAELGTRQAYLEVLETNRPAVELYESMRFRLHHRYHCRAVPDSPAPAAC